METQCAAREDIFPFLSLPPEIRNRIYGLLFEHEDPIYVVAGFGTKSRLHRRISDRNHRLFHPQQSMKSFQYMFNRIGSAFLPVNLPGYMLFFMCKQIHSEISSIFYMNNTFAVSNYPERSNAVHDAYGVFLLKTTVPWLRQLGSRAHMLRRLEIDIDALCPTHCRVAPDSLFGRSQEGFINVGPLLCFLWAQNLLELRITIVHSKNEAHEKLFPQHGKWHHLDVRPHCDLVALNEMMHSLQLDTIGIKMFWRTIGAVGIKRDGSGGTILFLTTSKAYMTSKAHFNHEHKLGLPKTYPASMGFGQSFVADCGKGIQMQTREPPSLMSIPYYLRSQILNYAFTYPEKQVLSICNAASIQTALAQFYVNKDWLHSYYDLYVQQNAFIVELKSQSRIAHFADFGQLSRQVWKVTQRDAYREHGTWPKNMQNKISVIRIVFEIAEDHGSPLKLANVRFNATPLIEATLVWGYKPISIHIIITTPVQPHTKLLDPTAAEKTITLKDLRSKALRAWPQPALLPRDQQKKCPQLWVDGTGSVVYIVESEVCTQFEEWDYYDQQWVSSCQKEERFHQERIKILQEESDRPLHYPRRLPSPSGSSAYQTWGYLQSLCT